MPKKPLSVNILIIVFIGLLSLLGSILSNLASNELFPEIKSLQFVWPLLGLVALALISLTVWQYRLQQTDEYPSLTLSSLNRQRMLARVYAFWIKGFLEQSLHGAALIAISLNEQPDALANPWHLVLQQPDQPTQQLPSGTRITQVYDKAAGEMLILGEPGSGKTTLLLELARDLLDRAQRDETHPMPVVFNLSSWVEKRLPLTNWFVEELITKYRVPRKLGQSWVDTDHILPLLDGLDEVSLMYRTACVEAINLYRQKHGLVPIVVCSRSKEYLTQKRRVLLGSAVCLQPLTVQQIDDYLSSAGGQLASVRVALRKDKVLQEMVTTPLMLSVLTLTYHGKPVEDLLMAGSPDTQRGQVFMTYVDRMLQRRGSYTCYTPQQAVHWLAWLAREMVRHNQTEFYIERLQPNWLPAGWPHQLYNVIAIKLINGILIGLTFGLLSALLGLGIGESIGGHHSALLSGVISGLAVAFISGLGFGSISSERNSKTEIEPTEIVVWSKSKLQRSWIKSLAVGLALGMAFVLFLGLTGWLHGGVIDGLILVLSCILSYVVIFGPGIKYYSKMLDTKSLVTPNQGIWLSARNGILFGLLYGLLSGLTCGVVIGLFSGLLGGLLSGVIFGIGFGVVGGMFGGDACIKHIVLRLILWRAGYAPLNYPHFLDYAAERILLRKVGGGYIFVHRLLQDYFASLDTMSSNKQSK